MISGIYQLTFPDQYVYIGQAVDINKRWEQHRKDFATNKHTKKMQAIYNIYGQYEESIIVRCHPDYLDALEANAIHMALSIECTLLNTSIPRKESRIVTTLCREVLELPAVELLQYNPQQLEDKIIELEEEIYDYEQVSTIVKAKELTDTLKDELSTTQKRIASYNERSWLYRLLNKV